MMPLESKDTGKVAPTSPMDDPILAEWFIWMDFFALSQLLLSHSATLAI
jgi:hypothetical protein